MLLFFAALDLGCVLAYGLPLALSDPAVWPSEGVGLVRVGVVSWVGASRGAAGKKEAVLAVVVVSGVPPSLSQGVCG